MNATGTYATDDIGTLLHQARMETGLGLDYVADSLGLSERYLLVLESGEKRPSRWVVADICDFYNTHGAQIDFDAIYGRGEEPLGEQPRFVSPDDILRDFRIPEREDPDLIEQHRQCINMLMSSLTSNEARAIELKYGLDGVTGRAYNEIGEEMGIQTGEAKILVQIAESRLKKVAMVGVASKSC